MRITVSEFSGLVPQLLDAKQEYPFVALVFPDN